MSDNRKFHLVSGDGENFEINNDVAVMSGFIKDMIDTDQPEDEVQEFPVPEVMSKELSKIIEFCNHYIESPMKEIATPIKSTKMTDIVEEWYSSFVDIEQEDLFKLILAANYMDIQPLLDLTCCTIASMVKGKTPEEIAEHFHCTREFIPCDEATVRAENKWVEEI